MGRARFLLGGNEVPLSEPLALLVAEDLWDWGVKSPHSDEVKPDEVARRLSLEIQAAVYEHRNPIILEGKEAKRLSFSLDLKLVTPDLAARREFAVLLRAIRQDRGVRVSRKLNELAAGPRSTATNRGSVAGG